MDGHRKCGCGSYAELIGSMHALDCYIKCRCCGARTENKSTPFQAWIAWDNEQLQKDDENWTLYELMK